MSEHEMIIPATSKGKCGYCGNTEAEKVSLTFECHICDEECDNKYFREYMRVNEELNKEIYDELKIDDEF